MEHLNREALARLVDESPNEEEAAHLGVCEPCAAELEALRGQTEALAALPVMMPPQGDWQVIEARLRSEGLLETPGLFQKLGLAQTPGWMRAAAAIVLFLSGTATGIAFDGGRPADLGGPVSEAQSVEEAAEVMRMAAEQYTHSLARYRELLGESGGETFVEDPNRRFVALEGLVTASQAAVRQAPADPFLNGILAYAMFERDAMASMVSSDGGNWF